jgi:CheY-like chemotaxis protein
LGLVISRKFIELMGGKITVRSQLQRGTTFQFDIRAQVVQPVVQRSPRRVVGLEPGQPHYRILVVDDKAANRQLLKKLLAPLGFDVRTASHGQEAIAIWNEWDPQLIWMDMRMPVMDGYEATQYIKSTTKGQATAVIALTASALEEQKAIVLSAGCDDFIRKPFQESEIFDAMQTHIGVRYLYAEDRSPPLEQTSGLAQVDLLTELRSLPAALLSELTQALYNVDLDSLTPLITTVKATNPALATVLQNQIDNYAYEQILDAIHLAKSSP